LILDELWLLHELLLISHLCLREHHRVIDVLGASDIKALGYLMGRALVNRRVKVLLLIHRKSCKVLHCVLGHHCLVTHTDLLIALKG
jgi:hypothetical protein